MSVEDGDTVATLSGHEGGIWDIRFSPDGTLVGSTSSDGELIVWDTATLGRRSGGKPWIRSASASARTMT